MVVPARATPSAARYTPLSRRRAPARAPFDDVFVAAFGPEFDGLAVLVGLAVGVGDAEMLLVEEEFTLARLFPMDDVVVHEDVAGAGCGGGVAGSPWWNVEPPYTPIGSPESPAH